VVDLASNIPPDDVSAAEVAPTTSLITRTSHPPALRSGVFANEHNLLHGGAGWPKERAGIHEP
jgi:hypothetical protein